MVENMSEDFRVVGTNVYDIPAYSNKQLTIIFDPQSIGAKTNKVAFTGDQGCAAYLIGNAVPEPTLGLLMVLVAVARSRRKDSTDGVYEPLRL